MTSSTHGTRFVPIPAPTGELQLLRRRVHQLSLLVCASSLVAALGLIRTMPDVLDAREFRLVDDSGRAGAVLGFNEQGFPGLFLFGDAGEERCALEVVRADGGPESERRVHLVLRGDEGERLVELSTTDEGNHGDYQRLAFYLPEDDDGPELEYMQLGSGNRFVTGLCKLEFKCYDQRIMTLDAGSFGASPSLYMVMPEVPENHPAHGLPKARLSLGVGVGSFPQLILVGGESNAVLSADPARGPDLHLVKGDAE